MAGYFLDQKILHRNSTAVRETSIEVFFGGGTKIPQSKKEGQVFHNLKSKDDILGREGILFGSTKTSELAENHSLQSKNHRLSA